MELCQFEVKKQFSSCALFHFISKNQIIHILMYFIETVAWDNNSQSTATKKGQTSNKIRSNKLPVSVAVTCC